MNQQNQNRGAKLLEDIRTVDFCLVETVLYLDAYPDNAQALAYYHDLVAKRQRLVAQYEQNVGPLSAFNNDSTTSWDWIKTPWPWELAANIG